MSQKKYEERQLFAIFNMLNSYRAKAGRFQDFYEFIFSSLSVNTSFSGASAAVKKTSIMSHRKIISQKISSYCLSLIVCKSNARWLQILVMAAKKQMLEKVYQIYIINPSGLSTYLPDSYQLDFKASKVILSQWFIQSVTARSAFTLAECKQQSALCS